MVTVAGGRVFFGGDGRAVYSLDARTGCIVWRIEAAGPVRSAVVVGPRQGGGVSLYLGDATATVYSLDPADGRVLWSTRVDTHPSARITGSPVLFENRLYVPVSSLEEGQGSNAKYECCTFRGSVAALDASNGRLLWQTHTLPRAEPIGKNRAGVTRWGPSGAAIWSAPTVDPRRRLVYATTGNMYTEPQQSTSNAIIAFRMDNGAVAWIAQLTPQDVFVVGCGATPGANCPDEKTLGPDFDLGNSAILATVGGRDLLLVGSKSGIGWALDPDRKGAVVWQYRAGQGSALGGMEWGSAFDGDLVYFPVSDVLGKEPGGLDAVRPATGERAWFAPPAPLKCGARSRSCNGALMAADLGHPRSGVRGIVRRRRPGALHEGRLGHLGLRHQPDVRDRQRRRREGRHDQRPRPGRRGRHALHQLGLRQLRRPPRQRPARLRDRLEQFVEGCGGGSRWTRPTAPSCTAPSRACGTVRHPPRTLP